MSIGFAVLAIWLVSAANGAECYARANGLLQSGFGRLLLIGWSFAFFFHLSNGVRHLFWDAGKGFEKSQANASAWFAIILSVVVTMVFWILIMVTL